jgi:hypothetical protein
MKMEPIKFSADRPEKKDPDKPSYLDILHNINPTDKKA